MLNPQIRKGHRIPLEAQAGNSPSFYEQCGKEANIILLSTCNANEL